MAVKLARYIFKRIRGRIIPIRIGTDANKTSKGSSAILRKLKLLMKSNEVKITNKGNLKIKTDFSGTDYMDKFMKKTGSVRVSSSDNFINIDPETKINNVQKSVLSKMSKNKEIYTEKSSGFNFNNQIQKATKGKPSQKSTKTGESLLDKARRHFGLTNNDDITGYVTPKGEKLNFSYGYGQRDIDHRQVSEIMNLPATRLPKKGELNKLLKNKQYERKNRAYSKSNPIEKRYVEEIKELKNMPKSEIPYKGWRSEKIKYRVSMLRDNKKYLRQLKKNRRK